MAAAPRYRKRELSNLNFCLEIHLLLHLGVGGHGNASSPSARSEPIRPWNQLMIFPAPGESTSASHRSSLARGVYCLSSADLSSVNRPQHEPHVKLLVWRARDGADVPYRIRGAQRPPARRPPADPDVVEHSGPRPAVRDAIAPRPGEIIAGLRPSRRATASPRCPGDPLDRERHVHTPGRRSCAPPQEFSNFAVDHLEFG